MLVSSPGIRLVHRVYDSVHTASRGPYQGVAMNSYLYISAIQFILACRRLTRCPRRGWQAGLSYRSDVPEMLADKRIAAWGPGLIPAGDNQSEDLEGLCIQTPSVFKKTIAVRAWIEEAAPQRPSTSRYNLRTLPLLLSPDGDLVRATMSFPHASVMYCASKFRRQSRDVS